jgi:hypothetical protein
MPVASGAAPTGKAPTDWAETLRQQFTMIVDPNLPPLKISDRQKQKLQRMQNLVTSMRGEV